MTHQAIAERLGMTRVGVIFAERRALRKLRMALRDDPAVRDFVGEYDGARKGIRCNRRRQAVREDQRRDESYCGRG